MNAQLRITRTHLDTIRDDLRRAHPFAAERIGILYCRFAKAAEGLIILAHHYIPVPDGQYVDDPRFGAVIGSAAFGSIIQHVYDNPVGAFHVHMHAGKGMPRPSFDDLNETARFVPDFFHGRLTVPHGALILSDNLVSGRVWLSEHTRPTEIQTIRTVGSPMHTIKAIAYV